MELKLKRNYLKSEEIDFIVNELLKHDSVLERKILNIGMIAQLLVENEELSKLDNNSDIYNFIMENDPCFIDEIYNSYDIENIVREELSLPNVIKKFLSKFEEKFSKDLDKFSNVDFNEIVGNFKNMINTNVSNEQN